MNGSKYKQAVEQLFHEYTYCYIILRVVIKKVQMRLMSISYANYLRYLQIKVRQHCNQTKSWT